MHDSRVFSFSLLELCVYRGGAAAQQLGRVLDIMHATNARLGGCYVLAGPEQRHAGSHGVVQAAQLPGTSVSIYPPFFFLSFPCHLEYQNPNYLCKREGRCVINLIQSVSTLKVMVILCVLEEKNLGFWL